MNDPSQVIGAVAEIFTWVGIGAGALLTGIALLMYLADGTWLPVRAVVEPVERGHVVRWIDDKDGVNEAPIPESDLARLGGGDMADIFYRRDSRNVMRLTRESPAVRAVMRFAGGLLALGVLALILSWVLLAFGG